MYTMSIPPPRAAGACRSVADCTLPAIDRLCLEDGHP